MSVERLKPHVENVIFEYTVTAQCDHNVDAFHLDYDNKTYRQDALYSLIREAVPYFALTPDEFAELTTSGDLPELNRLAWSRISTAKALKKGDYGELLLFLLLALAIPQRVPRFVTKVRLRSSTSDQIKGFDCAHFTIENGEVCLWLGEAKFHKSFSTAVGDAFDSVREHITHDYLKKELSILGSNIEINRGNPLRAQLENALTKNRAIDRIRFKIPVLLTYDSACIQSNCSIGQKFKQELELELSSHVMNIDGREIDLPPNMEMHFLLFPLHTVREIKDRLDILEGSMR